MEVVIEGPQAAVELLVLMNLLRWTEFAAPCLSLVTQLTLPGAPPPQAQLQAVVDEQRKDQVEYQIVTQDQTVPLTTLPTNVQGMTVINYGTIVETGNINGTGIASGSHTVSKGNRAAATRAEASQKANRIQSLRVEQCGNAAAPTAARVTATLAEA
jgi:hypothetical protein